MNRRPNFRLLGSLKMRQRLGEGAMGEVFLAEMAGPGGFNRLVAVKQVHPKLSHHPQFVHALIEEARLGGCLNHPNIVQTLALQWHRGTYRLVMEYVDGITLADLLTHARERGAPVPTSLVLDLARQICDGLHHAHTARDLQGRPLGMIHRDLKPQNILLSPTGIVKIGDFGISRATSLAHEDWEEKGLRGTLAYMSPEQARCESLDARADLYSLGAILFELVTLQRLQPLQRGMQELERIRTGNLEDRLTLLDGVPTSVADLIRWLVQADRENRPRSALAVRSVLNACTASLPAGSWCDPTQQLEDSRRWLSDDQQTGYRTSSSLDSFTTLPFPGYDHA